MSLTNNLKLSKKKSTTKKNNNFKNKKIVINNFFFCNLRNFKKEKYQKISNIFNNEKKNLKHKKKVYTGVYII